MPTVMGPVTLSPTATATGSTASLPVTWQMTTRDLVDAMKAKMAAMQALLTTLQGGATGITTTYVESSPLNTLTVAAMQLVIMQLQTDISGLSAAIGQVQNGVFTSVSASAFSVVQVYQGTVAVPAGPRITVSSTASASPVNVPLV